MTIREAVSLVLQASVIGEKGDTFVLDMGQPLLVMDLVRTLIKLFGRNENQVAIKFTGLRQGEKLVEELFYENEGVDETSFPKIKRARGPCDWNSLLRKLDEVKAALFMDGPDDVRAKIEEIVPEYSYLSADQPKENVALFSDGQKETRTLHLLDKSLVQSTHTPARRAGPIRS